MENKFENILDKDEKIEKIFKPNKTKMVFSSLLVIFFTSLFYIVPMLCASLVKDENGESMPILALYIALALTILILVLTIICIIVKHKNTFYAYTNKRIIIRTGIIGIDYKCLDLKSIGAVNVNVSWLDKLLHKNTGTITFGSMSSPLTNQGFSYMFASIVAPYEVYKEIKEKIEEKN